MNERKRLGKIQRAVFGTGGYQDAQFGLFLTLGGESWGVQTSIEGGWGLGIKCGERCAWTEEDRTRHFGDAMRKINQLLLDAKVDDVTKLVGVPVEVTFDSLKMTDWRVLKEVL